MHVQEVVAEAGRARQGMSTARQLRGAGIAAPQLSRAVTQGQVVRLRRRVYALEPLRPVPRFLVTDAGCAPEYVAQVRAALLSHGGSATAAGRTAAAVRGWGLLVEPARTLEIAVPHGWAVGSDAAERIVQRRRLSRELLNVLPGHDPLWVTTAAQTVIDCALTLPLLQGVVMCDSALRSGQVGVDELLRLSKCLPGRRDAQRARRVLELCDALAASVLESVLRVRMVLAGMSGFRTQYTLLGRDGRHVLRADFCFVSKRLIVEVDGVRWHQDVLRDQRVDNAVAALGWRVLRYGWAEVVLNPQNVVAEIDEALRSAAFGVQLPSGIAAAAA